MWKGRMEGRSRSRRCQMGSSLIFGTSSAEVSPSSGSLLTPSLHLHSSVFRCHRREIQGDDDGAE
jgi:hypothetical protein